MKKMIICLAIIVSITAMTGDKNKNFGKWSIERFGLRIRAYTNKKEYSLDEKIIVKFDFKHANKEYAPYIWDDNSMPGGGLVKVGLIDEGNDKHVELTEETKKRWYGQANPFDTGGQVLKIANELLIDHKKDDFILNLTESYKISSPGKYSFHSERWVFKYNKSIDEFAYKRALIEIPPVFFEIKENKTKKEVTKSAIKKDKKRISKEAQRDMKLEASIPWNDGVFGLKTKMYIKPKLVNFEETDVCLHIVIKNFSNKIIPAMEYATQNENEIWDFELKNTTNGNIRRMGFPIPEIYLEEYRKNRRQRLYLLQKILPGEERYLKIYLAACKYSNMPRDTMRNSFDSNGEWTVNLKRTVFYAPGDNYNKDTTKEQIAFLKNCQKKELIFKPVHVKVINFPKIKKYIPPQVKD